MAYHLTAASKKGMSAKQLQRMLGLTYKSAWFLAMRIKEAMDSGPKTGPLGGEGKALESDETFVGGKKKNVGYTKGRWFVASALSYLSSRRRRPD